MSWIDPNFPRTMTGPGTNTYLVGRRDPILIDTGAGVPEYMTELQGYLAERGWSGPSRVVLTHRHRDHLGGVEHLRERFRGLRVGKMIHRDADLPEGVDDLREGAPIDGDGVTLVPLHTPGHASDHLCYYLPEEQALFTGDVVLSGSTTVIPAEDGDLLDYMSSLERLQALGVRRIYPAHGPVVEDGPALIAEYIEHRLMRERQILSALGDGLRTIPAMVETIYALVPKHLHAMAGQSVASHLKKLAREGRVREHTVPDAPSHWELL
jgi:glyoxylase-like metal-dependent hydrolase (beta-lactamase superfamily II)